MPVIPAFLLKKLYVKGSLQAEENAFSLRLTNSIAPGTIERITAVLVDGQPVDLEEAWVTTTAGVVRRAKEISRAEPLQFPFGSELALRVEKSQPEKGLHELRIHVIVRDVGPLEIPVSDHLG